MIFLLLCLTSLTVTLSKSIHVAANGIISFFFVVVQSLNCLTLCDSVGCNMPGLSVLHYFPEFAQTYVHCVNAIQPSHPLLAPSPAFSLSQHQGLFK